VPPGAAPIVRWHNRPVRWRMFLLLLGVPTLLTVGLVLLIRAGRSDVHDRVLHETGVRASGGKDGFHLVEMETA